jgi:3-methyladenine DNA glycosylase AlkD
MSTFYFIRKKDFSDTLQIAEILLHHPHDLIHKAVGWMIREIGKRDFETANHFLLMHYQTMPRTMLRYAIEKFDPYTKAFFMKKG